MAPLEPHPHMSGHDLQGNDDDAYKRALDVAMVFFGVEDNKLKTCNGQI